MLTVTGPLRGSLAHLTNSFTTAYGGRHMAFQPMEEASYDRVMREVLGQETMPTFDIKNTRYLLSFGADFLSTWKAPVQFSKGYGEFRQGHGRERGTLVQVDPRFSMTAANADRWVPIDPGMEGRLALSIAHVIISEGLVDAARINEMTGGQGAAALQNFAPNIIANQLGIPPLHGSAPAEVIAEMARDFAHHGSRSLAIGGCSTAAHTNGTFNLSATFALNFLVGSVGAEGGVKFNPPPPVSELAESLPPATTGEWHRAVERHRQRPHRGDSLQKCQPCTWATCRRQPPPSPRQRRYFHCRFLRLHGRDYRIGRPHPSRQGILGGLGQ